MIRNEWFNSRACRGGGLRLRCDEGYEDLVSISRKQAEVENERVEGMMRRRVDVDPAVDRLGDFKEPNKRDKRRHRNRGVRTRLR